MLSHYKTNQLQEVIDIIVSVTAPEKIFLLGAAQNCRSEESIFNNEPLVWPEVTNYTFMVLIRQDDTRGFDVLHDAVESRCKNLTPVTLFMEPVHVFNQWIGAGHPFANSIVRNGLLLHDEGMVPLEAPCPSVCIFDIASQQREFTRADNLVAEYLAGAELFLLRRQFGLAAFHLHQATEHACTYLVKLKTGYRPGTHNLDKLFRYCRPFSVELGRLFPRNTEKENNLFAQLQKAYVHGRYREDYAIGEKELRIITSRVKQLQAIVKQLADHKFKILPIAV